MRIYKYEIQPGIFDIDMPVLQFLDVQIQNGQPCLWAVVDEKGKAQTVRIGVFGTGHDLPNDICEWSYIGTFQLKIVDIAPFHGGFVEVPGVFHVFAKARLR